MDDTDPSNDNVPMLKTKTFLMSTLMSRLCIERSNKASKKEVRIQKEQDLEGQV